jgi:hypothetical protein
MRPSDSIGVKRILREVRVLREPEGIYAGQWGVWIGYPTVAVRIERPDKDRRFALFRARALRQMLREYADGQVTSKKEGMTRG